MHDHAAALRAVASADRAQLAFGAEVEAERNVGAVWVCGVRCGWVRHMLETQKKSK